MRLRRTDVSPTSAPASSVLPETACRTAPDLCRRRHTTRGKDRMGCEVAERVRDAIPRDDRSGSARTNREVNTIAELKQYTDML